MKRLLILLTTIFLFVATFAGTAWAGSWQRFYYSGGDRVYAIAATPDGGLLAGTERGRVLKWNGSSWSQIGDSINRSVRSLAAHPDGSIWAGVSTGDGNQPYVYRWNGSSWEIKKYSASSAYNGSFVVSIAIASDNSVWIITDEGAWSHWSTCSRWNGSSWENKTSPGYYKLKVLHDGSIAYNDSSAIYKWGGSSWTKYLGKPDDPEAGGINDFVSNPDGSAWVLVDKYGDYYYKRLYLYKNDNWYYKGEFYGSYYRPFISASNDGGVWIVNTNGWVWRFNGSSINSYPSLRDRYRSFDGLIDTLTDGSLVVPFNYDGRDGYIYRYVLNSFNLTPSPGGATGNLIVKPTFDGQQIAEAVIQVSTDGSNYSDLYTCITGSSYNIYVSSDYYKLRMRWKWKSPSSYEVREKYSNAVTVPALPPVNYTGSNDGLNWSTSEGRGWITLSWPSNPNANGYRLWVFDGNQYRTFDLGNVTSWDSRVARIYPTESQLDSYTDNSQSGDLFNRTQTGLDLRDSPNKLYRKTIGTRYDNSHNYWFRVTAYNGWMESDVWARSYTPTLPVRTDTTAPSGTVSVTSSEGLKKTYNTTVNVTVNANDSLSGIRRIEFSNDSVSYTTKYEAELNQYNGTNVANYTNTWTWEVPLGAGTKVVYVRITDAMGNRKVVTDTIALAEDMLPPSISLSINDGTTSTTSNNVTLTISVTDNASTTSQMQMAFSNDGNLWSPWEPYQQTKSWDITNSSYGGATGAGVKKVYCRIYDNAQNIGLASAEIGYNPSPPTGTLSVSSGVTGTYNGKSVIFVSGDTPILNIDATGASKIRYDSGIGIWSDWEDYVSNKEIVLAKSSGVCLVRIQVKDNYGVTSDPEKVLVVIDGQAPVISSIKTLSGATATTVTSIDLIISVQDNISKNLQYDINGGTKQILPADNIITAPISGSGLVQITVNVYDEAGNKSSQSIPVWVL